MDNIKRYLANAMKSGYVDIGFMEGATYPDGTSVPEVAFLNEFGRPLHNQPPRPYFRRMIAKEKGTWGDKLARIVQQTHDTKKALGWMGEDIASALRESINELREPPLSPVTIARKGFDKPLIDTSHMINSVTYRVHE